MTEKSNEERTCAICGNTFSNRELVPAGAVRESVMKEVLKERPGIAPTDRICRADLNRFRAQFVHAILESEKGELTDLEQEVITSLRDHELLAKDVDAESAGEWTLGERLSDRIAAFGGSWTFLICFGAFLALWIGMNTAVLFWRPPDPYPFIFLNLVLSCLAAIQAPIIMMNQRRQDAKDRLRARHDYQVNLKAELEIRHLHEKVDHLLSHQWERLVAIQEVQLELLSEISRKR